MKLALAVAVTAVVAALSPVAPASAAPSTPTVSVDWPEVTRFNPTSTTYDAVITDRATGVLFFTFSPAADAHPWNQKKVPTSGHVVLAADTSGTGVVRIWSCASDSYSTYDGSCAVAATSPRLVVYSKVYASNADDERDPMKAGVNRHRIYLEPDSTAVANMSATWELHEEGGAALRTPVTGTIRSTDLVRRADGSADLGFDLPATLANRSYEIDLHLSVDDPDLGHLEGELREIPIEVDTVAPRVMVSKPPTAIYPERDGYLDGAHIDASFPDGLGGDFEVFNSSGTRVFRRLGGTYDEYAPIFWSGRDSNGRILPEGTYTLRLASVDLAGNKWTWSGRIGLSHKSVQTVTWKRTIKAAPYMTGKLVGKCSTLARKARGALGFYSEKKCHGDSRKGTVAANFGIYVPKAFQNRYSWAKLSLDGGPATSSSKNYLILAMVRQSRGQLASKRVLRGGHMHEGHRMGDIERDIWDGRTERPYLIWTAGLTDGSRYDIRRFTIEMAYKVLR